MRQTTMELQHDMMGKPRQPAALQSFVQRCIGGDNPIVGYCHWICSQTIRSFAELDHETSHAEWLVPDSVPTTEAEPSQMSRFTAQRFKAKKPDAVRDKGVNFLLPLAALFRVVIKVS